MELDQGYYIRICTEKTRPKQHSHQPRSVGTMRRMGQRIGVQRTHPRNDSPPTQTMDCRGWDKEENNLPLLQAQLCGHTTLFRHRYLYRVEDANA